MEAVMKKDIRRFDPRVYLIRAKTMDCRTTPGSGASVVTQPGQRAPTPGKNGNSPLSLMNERRANRADRIFNYTINNQTDNHSAESASN
jgi:hypothetical protein